MTVWGDIAHPNPPIDPSTTVAQAMQQVIQINGLLRQTLEHANVALDERHATGWIQQIDQAASYLATLKLYGRIVLLGDTPDPTLIMRSVVEKSAVGDWITIYQAQVAVTLMDPRLAAGDALLGMSALEKEGMVKKSNRGGGRAQWQRLK